MFKIKSLSDRADALCMAIVPKRPSDKIEFYRVHLQCFAENAESLGITPEEVDQLQALVDAARDARREQQEAMQAARTQTGAYHLAVQEMSTNGAAILDRIRSTAKGKDDPTVFTLAGLPKPASHSIIGAPGTPTRLTTTLQPDGSLRLKWTCPNPRGSTGTVYQVYRGVAGESLVYLACVGTKAYLDETIPKGATTLLYKIQAVRSTKVGEAALFNVSFGSNGAKPLPKIGYTPRHAIATSLAA